MRKSFLTASMSDQSSPSPVTYEVEECYGIGSEVIEDATTLIKGLFYQPISYETKWDGSPVTYVDKKVEEMLREKLMRHFPDHGILGEEFGDHALDKEWVWIIDPIDGTKSFIRKLPFFGILLALCYKHEPVLSFVCHPILDERYWAKRGGGAFLNGSHIEVSHIKSLSESLLLFGEFQMIIDHGRYTDFRSISDNVKTQRGFGDCYGQMLVASSRAEIMFDPITNPWDIAATKLVVEEAGGKMTNFDGHFDIFKSGVIITNGYLHDEVLSHIKNRT